MQSLIDNCKSGYIHGEIVLVISSCAGAFALQRAKKAGISGIVLERKRYKSDISFGNRVLKELKKRKVDLVCLAGFLFKISSGMIKAYKGRIVNIHPALLPRFGGKGMYGIKVHEEVIKSRVKYSGCTVHFVDEKYDHGMMILQKKVKVQKNDIPEVLQKRILKQEHEIYPRAVRMFAMGKIPRPL